MKDHSKYILQENGDYHCRDCQEVIMGATVAHSIHDGFFPLSGSGKCEYETVPYCPKCESKPNYHGSPIQRESNPFY